MSDPLRYCAYRVDDGTWSANVGACHFIASGRGPTRRAAVLHAVRVWLRWRLSIRSLRDSRELRKYRR